MAPPFHANEDPPSSSAHSIYTFPPPKSSTNAPLTRFSNGAMNGTATTAPMTTTAATTTSRLPTAVSKSLANNNNNNNSNGKNASKTHYIFSPIPAMAASFLLRRRLLLPTLAVPTLILAIPPLAIFILSLLACHATGPNGRRGSLPTMFVTSTTILIIAFILSKCGRSAIERHAPTDLAKKKALANSAYALPFWSLVASIGVARVLHYCLGAVVPISSSDGEFVDIVSRGWMNWGWDLATTTVVWSIQVAGVCVGPALAWTIASLAVLCRYAGPFCPIVRCSSTPLRTNPFDATLGRIGRNFASKNRFLDMIADGLDKLSAPSNPPAYANAKPSFANQSNFAFPTNATTNATVNAMYASKLPNSNGNVSVGRLLKSLISSTHARYSRPGVLSILVQVVVHAMAGHVFARAFVYPHLAKLLGNDKMDDVGTLIVMLSCLLVPVFELFASIGEAELHYGHYSSAGLLSGAGGGGGFRLRPAMATLARDAVLRARRSGVTLLAPVVAAATILLWNRLGSLGSSDDGSFVLSPLSYPAIFQSLIVSYLMVTLLVLMMSIQDILTRWAVCVPGMDADVLVFQTLDTATPTGNGASSSNNKFLTEDLYVQSILMGDGATVEKVITSSGAKSNQAFTNHQDEEIKRNEIAATSFSEWIQTSSSQSSGKLADDILRIGLLESLGGGGSSNPTSTRQSHHFYFGHIRHSAAIRKRLDLSAATTSLGQQPITVPLVRALCAFAGGEGDAMSRFYHKLKNDTKSPRKNSTNGQLWKLPPGSLNAMEYAIIAAARLVVMNSVMTDKHGRVVVNASKRRDRLSLSLPCILQSAYKLRCGILSYAQVQAKMYEVDLSTYDKSDKGDGLGCFIATKCIDLCPVISACNNSAKMAMKALVETGDRTVEELLLRKWKGDMQKWLVELNCEDSPMARTSD